MHNVLSMKSISGLPSGAYGEVLSEISREAQRRFGEEDRRKLQP